MVHYKFYYFGGRGRGEPIRHILKLVGADYEEITVTPETWPSFKDEMPLYQVPVLEIDGVKIGQTLAIARYLGNAYGIAGKTPIEKAKLDMIGDLIQDAWVSDGIGQWAGVLMGFVKVDKDIYFKTKIEPAIDKWAPLYEKFLLENGNNGLLIGDQETWVDVLAAEFWSRFIDFGNNEALDAYPHIVATINRVHAIPAIRKHIEQRTKTPA